MNPAPERAAPGPTLSAPVFLSDLHLTTQRPRTVARFFSVVESLRERLRSARLPVPGSPGELVVLGDLFEYWVGDDAIDPARTDPAPDDRLGVQVAGAFASLVEAGMPVYLMHGNRDLLLGDAFLRHAHATLLPDPCVAQLPDGPLLLSHGDAWCTLDTAYQAFRAQARDPRFRAHFLSMPIEARRERIGQARAQSEQSKRVMEASIMDVTPEAVSGALRAAGVRRVLHGHTHRPARHDFDLDGAPATRWVLPDWDDEPGAPVRGGPMQFVGGELVAWS